MPDPAAIAGHPTQRGSHVRTLKARLQALGATPAEVAEFEEAWTTAQSDPVTAAAAEAEVADLVHLSDPELTAMLVAVRTGYTGTAQPDEAFDQDPGAVVTNVMPVTAEPVRMDATEAVGSLNVPEIIRWVGENAERAKAVLVAEDVRAAAANVYPRRTLRAGLEPLLP